MAHTKHLWRAILILVFGGVLAFGVRHFLIPESFAYAGFYRYNSLKDHMSQPVVHGGSGSCTGCHEEQATAKSEGEHAGVSCEVCHAPLAVHAKGDEVIGPMPVNRSHGLCAYCHQELVARPKGMAQIDIREHLVAQEIITADQEIPAESCIGCHDVHSPVGVEEDESQTATVETTEAPVEEEP